MSCELTNERAELYVLGLLDARDVQALNRHAVTCAACARRVGEAEETLLALESTAQPLALPQRRLRLRRDAIGPSTWFAVAAALVLGFVASVMLRGTPLHERAMTAMVESHFNHAQFAGGGPQAKILYARDHSWLYVIVADGRSLDVYAADASGAWRKIGTTQPEGRTSELFVQRPGPVETVQLRSGNATLESAKVR